MSDAPRRGDRDPVAGADGGEGSDHSASLDPLRDYDYELPERLIAQSPLARRDASRLLVLDRRSGRRLHTSFDAIGEHLLDDDLLVVNDTRVIPARLRARRSSGGAVEVLLVEPTATGTWRVLGRPARAFRPPHEIRLEREERIRIATLHRDARDLIVDFLDEDGQRLEPDAVMALAERIGETPTPPYIRRGSEDPRLLEDRERYQTVWATRPGAVAAPTAGLHFSREILEALEARGIERLSVTLHVGLDTFRPLDAEAFASGELHGERVEVRREAAERLREARRTGRRIVAIGTTTARTLESFARAGLPETYSERTRLFIRPPFDFQLVGALLTNFHLPRSSLLLLIGAFARREHVLAAYEEAIAREYRFYSYGDAMFIA